MNMLSASENLKREIGVRSLTLAIINQTIGTGIFVIPALITANLGAAAMLTYLVCGALIFLIALCFVPIGIFLGISSVLLIYLSIQLVTQGVLGGTIEAHKDAPLAAVAGVVFGKAGIVLITVTMAISMLGSLGGEILSVPRIIFAGARDGLMPKALSKIHPRFATPYVAILFYTSLGILFAIFGGFKQLAIIASASALIIYFGAALATLKLRKGGSPPSGKTFKTPGGFTIPILAMGVIVWLLSNLSEQELLGMVIFMVAFSLIYVLTKVLKRKN